MSFQISLDTGLVDLCKRGGDWQAISTALEKFGQVHDIRLPKIVQLLGSKNELNTAGRITIEKQVKYLQNNLDQAIGLIAPVVPQETFAKAKEVNFLLLPGSEVCWGAKPHLQIFGVSRLATEREMLWFFTHIVYHELTSYHYTPHCARVAEKRENVDDEIYWLKLLIRNEGIGNFPFIDKLAQLSPERKSKLRYFTYAKWVENPAFQNAAVSVLEDHIEQLKSGRAEQKEQTGNFKRFQVPAINLLGIQMARTIAERDGVHRLQYYASRCPDEFFLRFQELSASSDSGLSTTSWLM